MAFGPRDIYIIRNPIDQLIFYVGETQSLTERIPQHKVQAQSKNRTETNPLYPWLGELYAAGYELIYELVQEDVPYELRHKIECKYITKYLKEGQPLLNRINNAARKYMDCSLFSKTA